MKRHIFGFSKIQILLALGLAMFAANLTAASSPHERLLLDFNWQFHLGDAPDAGSQFDYPEVSDLAKTRVEEIGLEGELATNLPDPVASNLGGDISFVQPNFDDRGWRQLNLPHDWAVELPFDPKADYKHGFKPIGPGFPQNSIGWYRRAFVLPKSDKGKTLWLEFDGVYRNSLVWLNGHCLGRHLDGYSSFRYDISKFANYGWKNELVVRVDASRFEGWFYEGAGIYRHVWLVKTSPLHIAPDGIFITTPEVSTGKTRVQVQTEIQNKDSESWNTHLVTKILDPNGKEIATQEHGDDIDAGSEDDITIKLQIAWPRFWSPESPTLYTIVVEVWAGGKMVDQKETEFGIRTIAFDPQKGFLLNGKPYFLKGTCNHQDHAGVGTALPDALQYFRVRKLKEMGCNAIRTSHNPPTPELLDACDRLGMLVMDENRRMDTNATTLADLREMVLRDRNHPCVFIWSLGNEEDYLQGSKKDDGISAAEAQKAAAGVVTAMQNLAHKLDPTRICTVAMNHGWDDSMAQVIDVLGCNYTWAGNPDKFHATHPSKLMIATETASTRSTRGIYENDMKRNDLSAYDVNTTHYLLVNGVHSNLTAEGWWKFYAARPFMSGVFNWTGFDYRGEPTPFKWPSIGSYFGCIDTCGFPKDDFYYYQSVWTDKLMVHLLPHWNWPGKEGQPIDVWCYSNCKEVELFLNGKSLGKKAMPVNGHLEWQVKYEPGTLSAKGFIGGKLAAEMEEETSGAPAAVRLMPNRSAIHADGEDASLVTVSVVDAKGSMVPTADNLVHFELSGPGKIIGVGNGDPTCHEPDVCVGNWQRSVCNGLAQVIVQSTKEAGEIKLTATTDGLTATTATISVQPCTPKPSVP